MEEEGSTYPFREVLFGVRGSPSVTVLPSVDSTILLESMFDLKLIFLSLSGSSSWKSKRWCQQMRNITGVTSWGFRTFSSCLRSLVSSFNLCTTIFKFSFSSSSDSRKAFLSIAMFNLPSKSSRLARVLLLALSRSSFCCSSSLTYLKQPRWLPWSHSPSISYLWSFSLIPLISDSSVSSSLIWWWYSLVHCSNLSRRLSFSNCNLLREGSLTDLR